MPSRGVTPADLEDSDLWINGPQWLGSPSESDHTLEEPMPAECAVELRAKDRPTTVSLIVTKDSVDISQLIDCQKYSSMLKLLQVTTYLLKFVANLKNKTPSEISNTNYQAQAEVLWIKAAQKQFVTDGNFEKMKKQFNLFIDEEGLWRCCGRLEKQMYPFTRSTQSSFLGITI